MNHVFHGYAPYKGEIPSRTRGALVAFENGETTPYGLNSVQDRGTLFVGPNQDVYAGQLSVKTLVNLIWMLTHVRKNTLLTCVPAPLMKQFA